jgi:flagellin
MGMRIGQNITALTAQKTLSSTKGALDRSMQRLSSGSRINKASDDAAGLAVSETLKASIRGLKQANRNTQDGISLIQTGESALSEVGNMLSRMRELSIQAASDTINDRDRELTGREYNQLKAEIDRISESTEFNGTKLLNGEGKSFDFQVNTKNSPTVDRISFEPSEADSSSIALGVKFTDIFHKAGAQDSLEVIDNAIAHVSELRAHFGSIQSRLNSTVENLNGSLESMAAANSRIRDTDMAEESSEMAKQNIMLQSGISVLAQANQQPGQALSLLNKG